MEDYISIARERMAYLSQRITSQTHTKKLIKDIEQFYNTSPRIVFVLPRLGEFQEKKRLQFSVRMDQLGLKRLEIAHTLTNTLQHIEKRTGLFLIKPIFTQTRSFGVHAQSKIFPLCRPLPVRKSSCLSEASTVHPSMGLVDKLFRLSRKNTYGELL